jgi:hypothetical protein
LWISSSRLMGSCPEVRGPMQFCSTFSLQHLLGCVVQCRYLTHIWMNGCVHGWKMDGWIDGG